MLAAGALLTQGKVIETRQLWTGRPAKYVRDLTDEALDDMQAGVKGYVINGKRHREALHGAAEG
jgi:carbonic anhydrase/acetyltransferase-like protein (isoleucine patch superfamily)